MAIGLLGALLGSSAISSGGGILSTVLNAKFQSGENELDREQAEYLTRLQQSNALQQMRVQHAYETQRYQDLVKDLEAAGLNPALAIGSAGAPNASITGAYVGNGSHGSNHLGANIDLGSGVFNSAIAYMMKNDKFGASRLSKAIVNSGIEAQKSQAAIDKFSDDTIKDFSKNSSWLENWKNSLE